MQLSAARDLKDEILTLLPSYVQRDDGTAPAIAVGIAPALRGGDYRVAVRPRDEAELPPAALRYLERTTVGELDVRVTGPITASRARLEIGMATAHARGRLGTLGCFARRNADGRVGFVSNNHVIAAEDAGVEGDDVLYVSGADGKQVVARLAGDYPRLKGGRQIVDCAFALLLDDVDFEPAMIGPGELLAPAPVAPTGHIEVRKVGRTTGRTAGRISAFTLTDVLVDYSFGPVLFHEQ